MIVYESIPYIVKGIDSLIHMRIDVDLLDATSLAVTLSQGMFGPAGSIVFLLGLSEILESEVNDAYEERKALARKKGEEAGTKLLLPMGIMLVISMAIIIIPAFLSMGI